MADTKITDLTTATTFAAASWFPFVDTTITAMANSGTDLKISPANLIAGLLPSQVGQSGKGLATDGAGNLSWQTIGGGGSGTVTSLTAGSGLSGGTITTTGTIALTVPVALTSGGTGTTSTGTADQLLGVIHTGGTGLEYKTLTAGSNVTITPTAGAITIASGLPTIPTLNVLANTTGGTAAPAGNTLSAVLDAAVGSAQGDLLYRGGSTWGPLAPGSSWQRLVSGGASANPAWGNPRTPIFNVTAAGSNVTNTTTETSIFTGATIGLGSLTIPANRLTLGSAIGCYLWGSWDGDGAATITFKVKLGSVVVLTGVSGAFSALSGKQWSITRFYLGCQAVGASGKIAGDAGLTGLSTSIAGAWGSSLTQPGGGGASAQSTIDTTGTLAFDVTVTWSTASASDRFQLLGGSCWIDG